MNTTLKHIEALQQAALDMETMLRDAGRYSADADTLEPVRRSGKTGVAILFNDAGEPDEVIATGGGTAKLEKRTASPTWEASYQQINGAVWEAAVARSHAVAERSKGKFPVQNFAKPSAKQAQDAAIARRQYDSGVARNQRIAAQIKEASNRQWQKAGNR